MQLHICEKNQVCKNVLINIYTITDVSRVRCKTFVTLIKMCIILGFYEQAANNMYKYSVCST